MQIVINIPKEVYENIQRKSTAIQIDGDTLENAVLNGTPLPEGHGKLKDTDEMRSEVFKTSMDSYFMPVKRLSCDDVTKIIDDAPTIIEADKGEEYDG